MNISKQKYKELLRQANKLQALEDGGVDNWQFYEEALDKYFKDEEVDALIEKFIEDALEALVGNIDEPLGHGAGYGLTERGEDAIEEVAYKFSANLRNIINNET